MSNRSLLDLEENGPVRLLDRVPATVPEQCQVHDGLVRDRYYPVDFSSLGLFFCPRKEGALAAFEHQGAFTTGEDGTHLGGQAFHSVQDDLSLVARSEVNLRV